VPHDNYGTQAGDQSINVGVGDFRGAHFNMSARARPVFTSEQLGVARHRVLWSHGARSEAFSTFGIVTGVASLVGLYFTLFQAFPQPRYASWGSAFLFSFAIGVMAFVIPLVLKRKKFEPFLLRKYYLEYGRDGRIYLHRLSAVCPWCGATMNLRNVGPRDQQRDDMFICERNPKQHTVLLDPTVLPDVEP
jgi:hypothetical protein